MKRKIYLLNTPIHGNLGDHAIAWSEREYIANFFPEYECVEIFGSEEIYNAVDIIGKQDIVFITGGGYLGDLWPWEEERCRKIIELLPQNHIFFLPQTFYFADEDNKEKNIKEAELFYKNHPNVHFILRDKASYDLVDSFIGHDVNRCRMFPDMGLYQLPEVEKRSNKDILLCLRSDKERITNRGWLESVNNLAVKLNVALKEIDTIQGDYISIDDREGVLLSKLQEFASAKLVITDRLHGMIFAAATGTPCIALNNVSGKVQGVYEWIKHLDYVICVDEEDITDMLITKMLNQDYRIYDNKLLNKYFVGMADYINYIVHSNSIVVNEVRIFEKSITYSYEIFGSWQKYFTANRVVSIEIETISEEAPISIAVIPFVYCLLRIAWICKANIIVSEIDEAFVDYIEKERQKTQDRHPMQYFRTITVYGQRQRHDNIKMNDVLCYAKDASSLFNDLLEFDAVKESLCDMHVMD